MEQSFQFLPAFDAVHIQNYFSGNKEVIREIFWEGNESLTADLEKISASFASGDIAALRQSVHTIRPFFYLLGLPELHERLDNFFLLCSAASSVDELHNMYATLWPELKKAQLLIQGQCNLFGD